MLLEIAEFIEWKAKNPDQYRDLKVEWARKTLENMSIEDQPPRREYVQPGREAPRREYVQPRREERRRDTTPQFRRPEEPRWMNQYARKNSESEEDCRGKNYERNRARREHEKFLRLKDRSSDSAVVFQADQARRASEEARKEAERKNSELREEIERLKQSNVDQGNVDMSSEEESKLLGGKSNIFDSHFHIDRMKQGPKYIYDLEGVVDNYYLKGGISVFCDPNRFPSPVELTKQRKGGWGIALGIHPSYSRNDLNEFESSIEFIHQMMNDGLLDGLGEIGFDLIKGGSLNKQEELIKMCIDTPLIHTTPIILHVRGNRKTSNDQMYDHCRRFLTGKVGKDQKIQLHCFSGSSQIVNSWLHTFPNTYFSYSGMVENFDENQRTGVRAVPDTRLLIETDSPYFWKGINNSPKRITKVWDMVRRITNKDEETIRIINQNVNEIFRMK